MLGTSPGRPWKRGTVPTCPIDLSIVIVSHNHDAYLTACLGALGEALGDLTSEVILIDNCASEATAEVARRCYPAARLIQNERRRGFAANTNSGLRLSRGRYVLSLNPDTQAAPGAFETLVVFMDRHPEVGVCGPQLRFPDGQLQLSCRRFPTWRSVLARRTPLRRFLRDSSLNTHHLMAEVDHDRVQAVDWMLGACLLARREAIDEVGLLDEQFFLYVEDIDWCYRMWRSGWSVVYVPEALVRHHHLAESDRRWLTWHTLAHFRSMGRFFWKHGLGVGRSVPDAPTSVCPGGSGIDGLLAPGPRARVEPDLG